MRRNLLLLAFILFVSVARTPAQQTVFVPNCNGTLANDKAKFEALIAQIGGTNTGTIRIPFKPTLESRCTVTDIVIPSNISLDNTDGTGIVVPSGTLRVFGARINPAGKTMFYGPGTVISAALEYIVPGTPAGGDLSGTYPSPVLANTGVVAGSCSNCDLIIDAKGRILSKADGSGGGGGSSVSSVFGRTGIVVAQSGDYSAEQLSNGVTGSGAVALQNNATFVAPILGDAQASSINKVVFTAPVTQATLTIANLKTVTFSNTLTFSGTDSKALTLTGSLSIGADTTINGGGTLALGGFTGTLPATGSFALGADTLSVSSGNNSNIASHTHAITTSPNPGAAASILASNASGHLQLVRLGIGLAPTQPLEVGGNVFINAATANLFMKDTNTGWQSASSQVVTPQVNNTVRSTAYTSGLEGWNISAVGNAEFNNVDVRGAIRASIIAYNAIQATAGTAGVFRSAAKLRNNVTIPLSPTYASTTVAIDVNDADGLSHVASQLFAVNDILRLKDGLVGDTWFRVASVSDQTTFYRYTATIMAGSNNVTYNAGLGVADYGPSGSGFIIQTADQTNAPYLQMATHAGTFTSNDVNGSLIITPQLRLGNLNGSFGYAADTFGFGTGQYGEASKTWITVEQTNGIRIGNNTTQLAQWDTAGVITVGRVTAGQSNVQITSGQVRLRNNTTSRILLDSDGSGFLANNQIAWNSAGTLSVTGNANIAGWAISTTSLSKDEVKIAAGANAALVAGTAEAWFGKSATGYYGLVLKGTTAAHLQVVAGNPSIGSAGRPYITINDGTRYRIAIGELNTSVWDGVSTNSLGMKIWDSSGTKLVEFSDVQNTISGWTLAQNRLSAGSGATTVGLDTTSTGGDDIRIFAGNSTPSSAPFRVTEAGALTATSATITGAITATSGSLSGLSVTGLLTMSGASSAIAIGTTPPSSAAAGTGIWLDRTGLYGLASSVVQTKLDATSGQITAGAGNVALGSNGISIVAANAATSAVKWTHANIFESSISSYDNSSTQWNDSRIVAAGSTNPAVYQLLASSQSGPAGMALRVWAKPATSESYAEFDGTNFKGVSIGLSLAAPQPAPVTMLETHVHDAADTVLDGVALSRWRTTGSPSAGFGVATLYRLESSGFTMRDAARVGAQWTTATDGSRSAAVIFQTVTSAAALTEVARIGQGLQMGSPTGGDKGTGTINVATDVYKNNTAYTNPDYVLERWATGNVVRFAEKPGAATYNGPMSLDDLRGFMRQNLHLPRFGQNANHGLFSGGDAILASLEEAYIYILQLEERLQKLENKQRSNQQ